MKSSDRLLKNAHQSRDSRDFPHPSSLQRTSKYASAGSPPRQRAESLLIRRDAILRISGALHLDIFEQPEK